MTAGSQLATGTNFAPDAKIVIIGQKQGHPYLFYSLYTVTSPTAITLSSPYDGDTGYYQFQIER